MSRTIPPHDVIILLSVSRRKTSYDLLAEKKGDIPKWGNGVDCTLSNVHCLSFQGLPSHILPLDAIEEAYSNKDPPPLALYQIKKLVCL